LLGLKVQLNKIHNPVLVFSNGALCPSYWICCQLWLHLKKFSS